MAVTSFSFGALRTGEAVTAYRIENARGASATVLDYGAIVRSVCVPDRNGVMTDVVLGYDDASGYETYNEYLGATVGRVCGHVAGAAFTLNGRTYPLARNFKGHHLHGGDRGFDKHFWRAETEGNTVRFSRVSPDGEEGYPGTLSVSVAFTLTEDNALRIRYDADTDADTPVDLTNHSYFNLNGGGLALGHLLTVNGEYFTEIEDTFLPTGRILSVEGTPFDFRTEKAIGRDIERDDPQLRAAGGGYDHHYFLSGSPAAVLYSPETGIEMRTETDMPGMQLYTSNCLEPHPGKGGRENLRHGAVCLETQIYPHTEEMWNFPSPILHKGEHLHTETAYRFGVRR